MLKESIISGFLSALLVAPCIAQMSPDEAMERLKERQAAATTQPSVSEVLELKSVIRDLAAKNAELKEQNMRLRRLVPEAPQVGWNFSRIQAAAFARTLATGVVFNVSLQGKLQPGTPGERVELVSDDTGGVPLALGNSQVFNPVTTHQHTRLAQVALYNVFVNNNTPYDPTEGFETNIKRMTDAYVVLVNVDTGYVDFAERNDDIWTHIFAKHLKEETTIIMQETTTVIIKETPD